MLYYHKAIKMLLLTEKLKRKCHVLYETEKILTLREKCPNTEFFLVRIFPHSDSVFSPNVGKYRPEKTPYLDTFHAL